MMRRTGRRAGGLEGFDTADGMFTVGPDQSIIQWNRMAERVLGIRASEAIGKKCYAVLGGPGSLCQTTCPVLFGARAGQLTPALIVALPCAGSELKKFSMSTLVAGGPADLRIVHLLREFVEPPLGAHSRVPGEGVQAAPHPWQPPDTGLPRPHLSRRESQVLELLSQGMDTDAIANALGVRRLTARNHIGRLLNKLGATTRLQAVMTGMKHGLIKGTGGRGGQPLVREHLSHPAGRG